MFDTDDISLKIVIFECSASASSITTIRRYFIRLCNLLVSYLRFVVVSQLHGQMVLHTGRIHVWFDRGDIQMQRLGKCRMCVLLSVRSGIQLQYSNIWPEQTLGHSAIFVQLCQPYVVRMGMCY
jgi:hypothetical protein